MDTQLVIRAQRGDEEAFASLAVVAPPKLFASMKRVVFQHLGRNAVRDPDRAPAVMGRPQAT